MGIIKEGAGMYLLPAPRVFAPRYRRVLGFQIKYFRDVIVGELKKNKLPGSLNP